MSWPGNFQDINYNHVARFLKREVFQRVETSERMCA